MCGMKQILLLIIAGVVVAGCSTGYTVTLKQTGSNVVATGSGAINLTGLNFAGGGSYSNPAINASDALIETGGTAQATFERTPSSAAVDTYKGAPGPRNFGPGGWVWPDSASGDSVGIMGNWNGTGPGLIIVPQGYMSGTLSSSTTWNNVTLDTLGKGLPWVPEGDGVTPGTYVWTWGAGANQNFTLIIGPFKWWRWLLPVHWRFPFPEWRSWPPPWPPPRDLPRPTSGDRVLAK
jgi:hypothetical protein